MYFALEKTHCEELYLSNDAHKKRNGETAMGRAGENTKGIKMLGINYGKLDAKTCIVSLLIISLITLVAYSQDLVSVFNISGVFKQ